MNLEIFHGLHPIFSAIPSLSGAGEATTAGGVGAHPAPTAGAPALRPETCGDLRRPAVMAQRSVYFSWDDYCI